MADDSYPGAPRWVKVAGAICFGLAAFVLVVWLGMPLHGPGRHMPSGHGLELALLFSLLIVAAVALNWTGRWPGWPEWTRQVAGRAFAAPTRKLVLTLHIATSVGALGAVAGFLVLSIAGLVSTHPATASAAYVSMDLLARFAILPLLVASLGSGIVQALGSTWGLFRHYWVVTKLLLTVVVAVVLVIQLDGIAYMARVAAEMPLSAGDHLALRTSIRTHAAAGLLVLLIPVALSIYKPRGLTRHGWRTKRNAET